MKTRRLKKTIEQLKYSRRIKLTTANAHLSLSVSFSLSMFLSLCCLCHCIRTVDGQSDDKTYNYRRTSGISWLRPRGIVSNWELTTVMMWCWCSCFSLVLIFWCWWCSCFSLSTSSLLFLTLTLWKFRCIKNIQLQRYKDWEIKRCRSIEVKR